MLAASPCADESVNMVVASVAPAVLNAGVPPGYATASATVASYSYDAAPGPNTQACRIYHLSVATGAGNAFHCAHGNLGGSEQCGAKIEENLCTLISAVCGFGANATWQFSSETVCRSELKAANITVGTSKPATTDGNSFACRFYHAGVAATYLAGGSMASATDAEAQKRAHCSHILRAPLAGCAGMGTPSRAPTMKPATTTNTTRNSAATTTFSLLASSVAVASVFLL
jgi:hypothetical protein